MPLILIYGAVTVALVSAIVLVWWHIDKRLSGLPETGRIDDLAKRLEASEKENERLRERVEDLEAIATAGQLPERAK